MDKAPINKAYFECNDWLHTTYKGVRIFKYTTDLWRYEQIIQETNPDLIIETGTLDGGSALWLKDHSNAVVVSIDVNNVDIRYKGVQFVRADSLEYTVKAVGKTMVILDSDHTKDHVLAELKKYAPLVSKGCYLVVEDTFISQYLDNKDPNNDYSNGSSWEAVQEWDSTGFEQQSDLFTLSMNPGGWFKRV